MKKLKLKYVRIIFIDEKCIEISGLDIDHIETIANTSGFVVKIYHNSIRPCKSHIETCLYEMETIKTINQRWEKEGE